MLRHLPTGKGEIHLHQVFKMDPARINIGSHMRPLRAARPSHRTLIASPLQVGPAVSERTTRTPSPCGRLARNIVTALRLLRRSSSMGKPAPLPPPAGAQLIDLTKDPREAAFSASQLWAEHPSLVVVLRRPG